MFKYRLQNNNYKKKNIFPTALLSAWSFVTVSDWALDMLAAIGDMYGSHEQWHGGEHAGYDDSGNHDVMIDQ